MDPNDDILEELECGICMEVYKEPKTLPCIHTFCRVCLARHVISQKVHHLRIKGFECPLCRFVVRVPRPDAPLEHWANQMPNNTQIPRIIQTCRERINDIKKCQFHPQETVTSYCKMCNCVACGKCLSERHPSCRGDAFVTVKEMASKRREDIAKGVKELNREAHRMKDNEELVRGVMSGLSDAVVALIKQIQEHAQLSIDAISRNEAELLGNVKSETSAQLEDLKRAKDPLEEAADVVRLYKEEIESLKRSSTGSNFMDNLEVMKERRNECLEMLRKLQSELRPPSITFIENEFTSARTFGQLLSSSDLEASFLQDDVFEDSLEGVDNQSVSDTFEGEIVTNLESVEQSQNVPVQEQYSASSAQPQQTTPIPKLSPLMMYLKALGSPATNAAKRKSSSRSSKGST